VNALMFWGMIWLYYQASTSFSLRLRNMVEITVELFDQIERYLEQRAMQQDGEAARLLQALEAAEIERTATLYRVNRDELGQLLYGKETEAN
jgi:hypothetical protein